MNVANKKNESKKITTKKKGKSMPAAVASPKRSSARAARERVLVEFPVSLLQRADSAAREMEKNRSELIRAAVEQLLDSLEREKFETELAAGYAANAEMNLELAKEFAHVDSEGL
jgi:Arc/MetJ-type ribon-helix-helix transcriptional regulator